MSQRSVSPKRPKGALLVAALRGETLDDSAFETIGGIVDELSRKRRGGGRSPLYRERVVKRVLEHARSYTLREPPRGILLARLATLLVPRIPSRTRKRGPRSLLLEVETYRSLATALMQASRCAEARDAVLHARRLCAVPRVAARLGQEPAKLDLLEGQILVSEGQIDRGLEMLAGAASQFLAIFNERRLFAIARATYAGMLMYLQRHEDALIVFEESLGILIEAGDQPSVATLLANIGFCGRGTDPARAARCHRLSIEMLRRFGMTAELTRAREYAASELARLGRVEEAIEEYYALRTDFYAHGMETYAERVSPFLVRQLLAAGRVREAHSVGTAAIEKLQAAGCTAEAQTIRELLAQPRRSRKPAGVPAAMFSSLPASARRARPSP